VPSQSRDLGGVARRYASALYELADSGKVLDTVADDLRSVRTLIDDSSDLARVITSPVMTREDQAAAVSAIAEKAGFDKLTVKFLGLLARNRRLFAVRHVIDAFLAELARRRGEQTAEVVSAQPIAPERLETVKKALSDALGTKVALEPRVDPTLLGGLVVRVGSKMVDSSLATKLQKLRLSMKGIG
jgi:F-type H+-transporting ATPase subunit delta